MSPAGGNGFGTRTFWTAAIPDDDVQIHFGAGSAELHVDNLALDDYGKIPTALGPQWQTAFDPATVSFDVVWSGPITRTVNVTNGTNGDQFAGDYVENQAIVTWSGTNLATGFSFTANPGDFATSAPGRAFAELGHEGNGRFFSGGDDSAAPASRNTSGDPELAAPRIARAAPGLNPLGTVLLGGRPSQPAVSGTGDAASRAGLPPQAPLSAAMLDRFFAATARDGQRPTPPARRPGTAHGVNGPSADLLASTYLDRDWAFINVAQW